MKLRALAEKTSSDSTKAEMLELQTLLIDQVEEDDLDFDIREHSVYGYAIYLTHKGETTGYVVRINRADKDVAYGVKVEGKKMQMSFEIRTLVSDIHDWLNGWISMWR